VAPLSLIVSAFAPVRDARRTLTPQLRSEYDSSLLLIDLGAGRDRLGGSCLAQVFGKLGSQAPDCDDPQTLAKFFAAVAELRAAGLIVAYHDRSDGGLFVTLAEMAFAGHCGIDIDLGTEVRDPAAALFSEELGAVLQILSGDAKAVRDVLNRHGLLDLSRVIGTVNASERVRIRAGSHALIDESRTDLHRAWSETSFRMTQLRDNPACAQEQFATVTDPSNPGLNVRLSFDPAQDIAAPFVSKGTRRLFLKARGRKWRSCESRALTVTSKWRRRSIVRDSRRSMCT
jgi:phosphoribosylformylglycinamidine synthase